MIKGFGMPTVEYFCSVSNKLCTYHYFNQPIPERVKVLGFNGLAHNLRDTSIKVDTRYDMMKQYVKKLDLPPIPMDWKTIQRGTKGFSVTQRYGIWAEFDFGADQAKLKKKMIHHAAFILRISASMMK